MHRMKTPRAATLLPALLLAGALLFYLTTQPGISAARTFSKAFAVSAVVLLSVSLAVGPLSRLHPTLSILVAHRKYWGLTGFAFGVLHAFLAFGDPLVFDAALALSRPNVRLGLMALIVFALLAVTSNAWAQRKLGQYWKPLQQLGYLGLIFVGLDLTVLGDGTFIRTPLGMLLGVVVAGTLGVAGFDFLRRRGS